MSITPKRLSHTASRQMALDAARALLIEAGPQAVTLKAVAGRVGRTHANLLHHFGSAYGLQKALAEYITRSICDKIAETVRRNRAGDARPRDVVDLAFDAFDSEGAGALAGWMILTGNEDALDPIVETIHQLVDDLDGDGSHDKRLLHDETLALVLLALGDSLLGAPLAAALGLPRTRARDIGEKLMVDAVERAGLPHG
ncbi:MAG: TetR/AcrR family transcriptional regulator [Sphingopyxis sp.]